MRLPLLTGLAGLACLPFLTVACSAAPIRNEPTEAQALPIKPTEPVHETITRLSAQVKAWYTINADYYWARLIKGPDKAKRPKEPAWVGTLLSKNTLRSIDRTLDAATQPDEVRELTLLRGYVAASIAQRSGVPQIQASAETLQKATFLDIHRAPLPLRLAEKRIQAEASATNRRKLATAIDETVASLLPTVSERDQAWSRLLGDLGYRDLSAFVLETRDIDPAALRRLANDLLTQTDATWRTGLTEVVLPRLGFRSGATLETAALGAWDLPRALRTSDLDASGGFGAGTLKSALEEILGQTELDREATDLDLRPLDTDNLRRALAFPSPLPDTVHLAFDSRSEGIGTYEQAFHELGHAVAFGLVKIPSFAFANFGNEVRNEAAAHLFEGILGDPAYAAKRSIAPGQRTSYVRLMAMRRLYNTRADAAMALCDLARAEQTDGRADGACRAAFERALGVSLTPNGALRYIAEGTPLFASSDNLKGAILAAQMEATLTALSATPWWANEATGALLSQAYAQGNRLPLPQGFTAWNFRDLEPAPFATRMAELIAKR